ncbi:MAG: Ppx/GppA family phosphatase [Solirubrobacteraceae bacterium]|nr:Ppx/GppA family phosphatase [Solirubrobacteraceae bacterium]
MRVAVVDIGTNSTRLLVADVDAGSGEIHELARRSEVTRLGVGVDRTGRLSDEAIARVQRVLDEYAAAIDKLGAERRLAVLTSATRDAVNGPELTARVRDHYRLEAQTIPGEEEARLSFLGAMSGRPPGNGETVAVLDIGGGSTELIVGRDGAVLHHVSTQAGVVRHSERHLHDDPPTAGQRAGLAAEVLGIFEAAVPAELRERTEAMIAVAGTATSMAAIDQALEPYDSSRVHGYRLSRASAEAIGERLASMTDAERRLVAGLHPDRAPTIVAGSILLVEAMRAFGLDEVEVSEHDILYGVALDAARVEQPRAT